MFHHDLLVQAGGLDEMRPSLGCNQRETIVDYRIFDINISLFRIQNAVLYGEEDEV